MSRKSQAAGPPTKKARPSTDSSSSSSSTTDIEAELERSRLTVDSDVSQFDFNAQRVRWLQGGPPDTPATPRPTPGAVVYWMSRDQRVQDNWALLYGQKLAWAHGWPLHVVFCLVPGFLDATLRQYDFMIRGLQEVERELAVRQIHFHLLRGAAAERLPAFLASRAVTCLVTDFSPLRVPRQWVERVQKQLDPQLPFAQVDAHNVVPVWVTSDKQEYAARTIRSKIHRKLDEFLTEFPPVSPHPHFQAADSSPIDWTEVFDWLTVDTSVPPVTSFTPGTRAALQNLAQFAGQRIPSYADRRNDPNVAVLSNISPWAHFGQISMQRAVLYVKKHGRSSAGVAGFVEEAIVRRELSDNFCYYQPDYDNVKGAFGWAQKTLAEHRADPRPYLYDRSELEKAHTHDDLWNAAQIQMVKEGKMHGFLRMYWAKKILEWTQSPEEALATAIYLNDRYQLDGRDPNGFVGCMWSICGIHDQGWAERKVFGKIRYMNYDGCKRKFDIKKFILKYGAKAHPYLKKVKK
ncbi:hypothetical protein TCAL_13499 [Tigriopus californicus]|uniref:Deoxyribodipyrimidine photo-lyase n=1 Tax=Tigriopus californicus TaxID=6832 RepID=A0A553NT40_TIGCA|nr:deoxyribodipyrimidine photo-lyase-like [Tigriopus californicus]TRY68590.1 hypothetical protein TCAL_13499 [Tigriopus californicus]|eukprot:TCALIF_13499-PA protein Name:"Similar to PHR Deoxyribodipyrimidine photo-lyase (Potorous tridactylus)" AED:0.05 eAED:0.05 QI:0/0/0/1/1/1/3/0/518